MTEVQTPKLLPRGETEGEVIAKIATGESHTAVVTGTLKIYPYILRLVFFDRVIRKLIRQL